jgi:hypothetical protein
MPTPTSWIKHGDLLDRLGVTVEERLLQRRKIEAVLLIVDVRRIALHFQPCAPKRVVDHPLDNVPGRKQLGLRGDVSPSDLVVLFVDALVDLLAFFLTEILVDPAEGFVALPGLVVDLLETVEHLLTDLRVEIDDRVFVILEDHPNLRTDLLIRNVECDTVSVVAGLG